MNYNKNITAIFNDGETRNIKLHEVPDNCPFCHHAIDPIIHYAYCNKDRWNSDDCLQVLYRCTRKDCDKVFITYYRSHDGGCNMFRKTGIRPFDKKGRDFTDTIEEISSTFCKIYNEALFAEQSGLKEICGVGYRKALEFLIKDYLIKKFPNNRESILNKFLGKCIDEDIPNDNIKSMAKRAIWLGNDETHYLRKWEGKDLDDLKKLIDAILYWIEMEKLTEETINDMPEN